VESNTLVVAEGDSDPALYARALVASDPHWVSGVAPTFPWKGTASIRYHHPENACEVEEGTHGLQVRFATPERAVAPGQFVVFFSGEELVGSAVIECAVL
jgi:tRNA-specific 2-thiouridylase